MKTSTQVPGTATSVRNLRNEMDRIFDELIPLGWRNTSVGMEGGQWTPIADLYENDNEYRCEIDLPGLTKNDIHVNAQNNTITVSGERKAHHSPNDPGYLRNERPIGTFKRTFALPSSIDNDKVKAQFKDGVLIIEAPKAEEAKSKSVSIS